MSTAHLESGVFRLVGKGVCGGFYTAQALTAPALDPAAQAIDQGQPAGESVWLLNTREIGSSEHALAVPDPRPVLAHYWCEAKDGKAVYMFDRKGDAE